MDTLTTILGVVLIVVALRDVFNTLFHPSGQGSLSHQVMKVMWRLSRLRPRHRLLASLAGPVGMLSVVVIWGALVVAGWALVYLAQMPDGLSYGPSLAPTRRSDVLDALYLSLVTVATLGFGDIVPISPWLRLAAPLEALIGFVLLTAAVSWVLQVYPALHRRRALALQLTTLRRARRPETSLDIDGVPVTVLTDLAADLVRARVDLTEYPATYFFRDLNPDTALAARLDYAAHLAREATTSAQPQARVAGALLAAALDSLAETLDKRFLHLDESMDAILRAYAATHDPKT